MNIEEIVKESARLQVEVMSISSKVFFEINRVQQEGGLEASGCSSVAGIEKITTMRISVMRAIEREGIAKIKIISQRMEELVEMASNKAGGHDAC